MAQPDASAPLAQSTEPDTADGRSEGAAESASAYCPRCSARLAPRSCKLICTACGYYMSCSDFY